MTDNIPIMTLVILVFIIVRLLFVYKNGIYEPAAGAIESISLRLRPASASIFLVCSPSMGASIRIDGGVSDHSAGCFIDVIVPRTGCSSQQKKSMSFKCG